MNATATKARALSLVAEPLLVSSLGAARLCGVSVRTWQALTASGETPTPVRLARKRLWHVATLKVWAAAGCPSRMKFEAGSAGRFEDSGNGNP